MDTGAPKILVVDDTASNRFLLRAMLSAAGYAVEEASDGAQCIEMCEHEMPAVILLDIMMPVMDGISACKKLRESYTRGELPVVMVTTKNEDENLPEAMKVGASDYITKPISKEVLLARVRNQLEIRNSQLAVAKALETQQAIADVLPHVMLIEDEIGKIVHANERCVEQCGKILKRQAVELFTQLYGTDAGIEFSVIRARVLDDPRIAIDEEMTVSAGDVTNVHIISRPIVLSGKDTLRVWLFRDVSHTRQLERKMNERVRLDTVSLFVGGVAHNFNNILGGVLGAVDLLERVTPPTDKTRRLMRIIRMGADSAAKLTRKMSIFTRQEVSNDKNYHESIADVLEAVALTHQEPEGDRIRFDFNIPADLPAVNLKLAHLLEIFNNLVSNAVDAVVGTGVVSITVEHIPKSKKLKVVIQDSGQGMDSEIQGRIFEPFYSTKNLDKVNSVSIEGRGLGLWNVYNLLELVGGDIDVSSQVGKGTIVTVTLPVVAAPNPA